MAGDRYDSSDEALIKTNIKNYLGEDVTVDIEKVDSVPRTSGGKFKQFISKIGCHCEERSEEAIS